MVNSCYHDEQQQQDVVQGKLHASSFGTPMLDSAPVADLTEYLLLAISFLTEGFVYTYKEHQTEPCEAAAPMFNRCSSFQ